MKKIISSILVLLIIVSIGCGAYAMHYGTFKGKAVYDGKALSTDFGSIAASIGDFQPGDDLAIEITLSNNSDVATDWYMENDILKAFEDSAGNDDGSYNYNLTYNGAEIFSSDTIGGSDGSALDDALNQLKDYFYLGRIGAHGTGTVRLEFGIDGETQNNDYWETLSRLNMRFAVEKTTDKTYIVPKTADKGTAIIWGTVTVLCLEAAVLLILTDVKKRKAEK